MGTAGSAKEEEITAKFSDNITSKINDLLLKVPNDITFDHNKSNIFYCWIDPQYKMFIAKKYQFDLNLLIKYDNNTYKYPFRTTFDKITKLYGIAYKDRNKYFVTEKFPTFESPKRSPSVTKQMNLMQKYMIVNKVVLAPKQDTICFVLNQLFNSALFVFKDYIYNILNISAIKPILQHLASEWLFGIDPDNNSVGLRNIVRSSLTKEYMKLCTNSKYKNMQFDTMVAVEFPLTSIRHWALKFIGRYNLLTLNYYSKGDIQIQVLSNNCIGHRIFWYSSSEHKIFIKRCSILSIIDFDYVHLTGNDIGCLLNKWTQLYDQYDQCVNNCQHFVRDIVCVFNTNESLKLTNKFSRIQVGGIVSPALPALDLYTEQRRISIVKSALKDELATRRNIRADNCKKIKKILKGTKHQNVFFSKLINAGFYDGNYRMIVNTDLIDVGMKQKKERLLVLNRLKIPKYNISVCKVGIDLKELLNKCQLTGYKYYDIFKAKGFNDCIDINILQSITWNEWKNEIKQQSLGHYKTFKQELKNNFFDENNDNNDKKEETNEYLDENGKFSLEIFLLKCGLYQYYQTFIDNGCKDNGMSTVIGLTDDELKDTIGMLFAHRKMYLNQMQCMMNKSYKMNLICNNTIMKPAP